MKKFALLVGLIFAAGYCGPGAVKKPSSVKIYALKYGESLYPARLVNTASRAKNVPLAWLAYLIEDADGHRTLIDCGFSDPKLLKRFGIQKFKPLTDILRELKIEPAQIGTIILTHTHFDHALDIDKFPKARIILHQRELDQPEEAMLAPLLTAIKREGRITGIATATHFGSLVAEPVMGHTKGSLIVRLASPDRNMVFTGDECYFAASCRQRIPLPAGAVYAPEANRRFIATLSPELEIHAGHETALTDGRWLSDYVFFFF